MQAAFSTDLSRRITLLRWPCAVLVVTYHCVPHISHVAGSIAWFYEWPWALLWQWLHAAVPFFLLAAGYLFFARPRKTYTQLLRGKLHRLLIPLLLWWALRYAAIFWLQPELLLGDTPILNGAVTVPSWLALIRPRAAMIQLWFLEDLVLFFALSPLLERLWQRVPVPIMLAALLALRLFLDDTHQYLEANALLHLYYGYLLARFGADGVLSKLDALPRRVFWGVLMALLLLLSLPEVVALRPHWWGDLAEILCYDLCMVALLRLAGGQETFFDLHRSQLHALASVSMFVYCCHLVVALPLLDSVQSLGHSLGLGFPGSAAVGLLFAALVAALVTALGLTLRRYVPLLYALLTGESRQTKG